MRDGKGPDSICFCSRQDCSDRGAFFEHLDAAVGIYRAAKVLRVVNGLNDTPEDNYSLRSVDLEFSSIRKIILRRRSTPPWSSPRRHRDGTYHPYDVYYQTRIYTATGAHYAPRGEESHLRLIDARYVCEWLCTNTGLSAEEDTQERPLDGYPEGV